MSTDFGLPRKSSAWNNQTDKDASTFPIKILGRRKSLADPFIEANGTAGLRSASDARSEGVGRHAMPAQRRQSARAVSYQGAHAAAFSVRLPTVSIVIPCRNNRANIRASVLSALNQDYPELREIILIGSPVDASWESMTGIYDRRLIVQKVDSPLGDDGISFKLDVGVRESSSDLVYLIDSSIVLQQDWLSKAVGALNERPDSAFGAVSPSSMHGSFHGQLIDRRDRGGQAHRTEPVGPRYNNPIGQSPMPNGANLAPRYFRDTAETPVSHRSTPPVRGTNPSTRTRTGFSWKNLQEDLDKQGDVSSATRLSRVSTEIESYAAPPTEAEKYQYLSGGQKRWFVIVQFLAFLGVCVSFAGFTASTYETLIFGVPLLMFAVEQTLALYTSTRRRRVDAASHRRVVEGWNPLRYPSVDVFVPTAGEELSLLNNTMRHLNLLQWPGELRVSILDDSGRIEVRRLAAKYGFFYLARPGSEFKKAGNLCYGAERTTGEIITIFDADFVPRPEFLLELVPYMDDPRVGIVQSPQFFDTTKQMNWIQRCAGSTQELFYRFIQPSRDALGAAVCVGTSALYRRTALEAIGGFPKIGQSEDIYTGLWMNDAGYSTRYIPVTLSKGVAPDNVDNFIAQQYRWCEGSMTMLASKRFHTTPNLSLKARLSYWSGFLYYTSTAISSLIIPVPAITMAWFFPQWVRPWNTIWLAGALVVWLVAYPMVMRGRWRIEVLRIQTIYGFAHLFNIIDLVRNAVVEWHPTGSKAPAPIAVKVKRFYTVYLSLSLIMVAAGLILRAAEDGITLFAGMLVFFVLNLYVVGPLVVSGINDEFRSRNQAAISKPVAVPLHQHPRPSSREASGVA